MPASGGVLSGVLAQGFVAVFSKIASIIIFTVLLVMLTMVALRLTVGALIEKHRERPRYEAEPEEPIQTGKRTRKPETGYPAESQPCQNRYSCWMTRWTLRHPNRRRRVLPAFPAQV